MASRRQSWLYLLHPRVHAAVAFVLSLVIATLVVAPVGSFLRGKDEELAAVARGEVKVALPTVTRILGPGAILTRDDLTLLVLEPRYVPDGVALRVEDVVGRTATERLLPGEAIREQRLVARDAPYEGLAALVPQGGRAISLEVADARQVAGLIEPGDRVDVLVTFVDDRAVPDETITLEQNLRVLAVDEVISLSAKGDPIEKQRVTLAVNPAHAERIVHAVEVGIPRLTLRGTADERVAKSRATEPPSRIGSRTYSVREWREKVSPDQYAAMVSRLEQERAPEPLPIDPRLLRPLQQP